MKNSLEFFFKTVVLISNKQGQIMKIHICSTQTKLTKTKICNFAETNCKSNFRDKFFSIKFYILSLFKVE